MHPPTNTKSQAGESSSPGKAKSEPPPTQTHDNPDWFRLATRVPAWLAVAPPDDPDERQAELVAEQVVAVPDGSTSGDDPGPPPGDPTPSGPPADAAAGGRPLTPADLAFFEPRFGHDLGGVRLHADAAAHSAAVALKARAFTLGGDIAFRAGQYAPESAAGRRLLAHELAHVALHSGATGTGHGVVRRAPDGPAPIPLLAEDAATDLAPGQMRRGDFLSDLARAVCEAVEPVIAPRGRTTENCPYIEVVFRYLNRQPLDQIERAARDAAPELGPDAPAADYIAPIADRARESAESWAVTGKITGQPEGLIPPALAGSVTPEADAEAQSQAGAGTEPPVRFRGKPGGARPGANPAAVRAELGPGSPVEGGVRSRMESAFGTSLGGVRAHTDAAAAGLADRLNARAFAVGEHVAFGPGEYRPGTPAGDALIAHELAHVVQQRGGGDVTDLGESGSEALEEDADTAAAGAVAGLWGGAEPAPLAPRRRSGLRLQRCTDGPEQEQAPPQPTVIDDNERMSKEEGYSVEAPEGKVVVGQTYRLTLQGPLESWPDGTTGVRWGRWFAWRPGEDKSTLPVSGVSVPWTLDKVGEWQFAVHIKLGPTRTGIIRHRVTVHKIEEVAEEELAKVQPTNLTGFLVRLGMQDLRNKRMGVHDQQYGPSYISLSGENPAHAYSNFPDIPWNTYTVHPEPGVTPARYQWVAVPDDLKKYPTVDYFGLRRARIGGNDCFDLGTGTTAMWPLAGDTGLVDISCTMYGAAGAELATARYLQVTLTREEERKAEQFRTYAREAGEALDKLRRGAAVYLRAVHVTTETGGVNELTLFVGPPASGTGLLLIDATPGVAVREYPGANFEEAIKKFGKDNSYPPGHIRLQAAENSLGIPTQPWTMTTTGQSLTQRLSSAWGWASLGLAGLGALATVIPGAQPLAPVFFYASAGLGALSAGASLYQRTREAHPSPLAVAIDIAALAGSLLGLAGAGNILRHGPRVAAATRTGQFVLYAGFATDVLGGVFIAAAGADQIADVLEGGGTPDEKATAVVRILAGLMLNGALLAWGAKNLKATQQNIRAALGEAIESQLTNPERHALSLIEGPGLNRLAQLPAEQRLQEAQRLAALIREDPVRAGRLIDLYGVEPFVRGAQGRPTNLGELAESLSVSRRAALAGYAAANLHQMVDAAAAAGLSRQLGVEVSIDTSLGDREILVEYKLGSWLTGTRIGIRVGPQASVGDVFLHTVVLDRIREYRVLTNNFRGFASRAKAWLGGQRMTRAAELAAEIDKHGLMVEARLAAKRGDVSAILAETLQRDIDELQGRMVAFRGELTQLGAPQGVVAAGWSESFSQQQLEALLDVPGSGFQRYRHPTSGNPISEPGFKGGQPLNISRAQGSVPALRGQAAGATFPDVYGTEIVAGQNVAMELKTVYPGESVGSFFRLPDVRDNVLREMGGRFEHLPQGTVSHLVVDIRQTTQGIPAALTDLSGTLRNYRGIGDARRLWDGVRFITGTPDAPVLSGVYQIP